MTKLIKVQV